MRAPGLNIRGGAQTQVKIIQTAQGFLYLPLYYARRRRFFGHVPPNYEIRIVHSRYGSDVSAFSQMMDGSRGSTDVLFSVCDPAELLMGDAIEHLEARLLCGLVRNAAFWAVDRGRQTIEHHTHLARYPEIITFHEGTTGYYIADKIRRDAQVPQLKIRTVNPEMELSALANSQDAVAITPDILGICHLQEQINEWGRPNFQIEFVFGNSPEFAGLLVTGLMTHRVVIEHHEPLARGLVLALQEAMEHVRAQTDDVVACAEEYFRTDELIVRKALKRAVNAEVFPTNIEVQPSQLAQVIKVRTEPTLPNNINMPLAAKSGHAYAQWVAPTRNFTRKAEGDNRRHGSILQPGLRGSNVNPPFHYVIAAVVLLGGAFIAALLSTPAFGYAVISVAGLSSAALIGRYLLRNPGLLAPDAASARSFFVLLLILGLSSAAFLFGFLQSTASLSGTQFGTAFQFGGPVVVAILVVIGGFYLTKSAEQFALIIRLKSDIPITDLNETFVRVDLGGRRDKRAFSPDGEATINEVPARFMGQEISIEIESKSYRLRTPNLRHVVPPERVIYLAVDRMTLN